jgi:hypothetical protein
MYSCDFGKNTRTANGQTGINQEVRKSGSQEVRKSGSQEVRKSGNFYTKKAHLMADFLLKNRFQKSHQLMMMTIVFFIGTQPKNCTRRKIKCNRLVCLGMPVINIHYQNFFSANISNIQLLAVRRRS